MIRYFWNKFWLWLSYTALFRTNLDDFPCFREAESGLVECQEFNDAVFKPATVNTPCPFPVDGNNTVGKCMDAGWCGCKHGTDLEPGYEPWAAASEGQNTKAEQADLDAERS